MNITDDVSRPRVKPRQRLAGDTAEASGDQLPGSDLARQMRRRWEAGERPCAEEYLIHERVSRNPEEAIDVIYEEFCLRAGRGEEDVEREILARFPQHGAALRIMFDCHRVLCHQTEPVHPEVGELVGGFRIVEEIGSGARGRVFLASQTDLAARRVVLKLTPLDGGEHLCLARLQHTNIVPVYSVEDNLQRNVRILCMPFFGRVTLSSLLRSLSAVPMSERSGKHLIGAMNACNGPHQETAVRQMLAHVSYAQAACWITACLADALHHAHGHGLVHLDVKPSNVLMSSDGQPMLLDFHLAREPISGATLVSGKFGGTPAYMAPEQAAVVRSFSAGRQAQTTVDARADIYSLGATLYEMLGGKLPIAGKAPSLTRINASVSVGLDDIISTCLEIDPARRYGSAAALADDLRHHLSDQPLRAVANRSVSERWSKWRRRRPGSFRLARTAAVLLVIALVSVCLALASIDQRLKEAERVMHQAQTRLQSGDSATDVVVQLSHGLRLIEHLPFSGGVEQELRSELEKARRLLTAQRLHDAADRVRVLFGAGPIAPGQLPRLTWLCREFWERRHQLAERLAADKDPEVRLDLLDIALFWADLSFRTSDRDEVARQSAIRILDSAEEMFGPSPVLDYQRQLCTGKSPTLPGGYVAVSGRLSDGARAWEHYALGRSLLASGRLTEAANQLEIAWVTDPTNPWSNFYYGVVAFQTGRHQDAVTAFSVCIGAKPDLAACFQNRALAFTALDQLDRAISDYDRALVLDSALGDSWLNRGILHYKTKRYPEAVRDIQASLRRGANLAAGHYNLALVRMAMGDAASARHQLRRALAHEPSHGQALLLGEALRLRGQ